MEMILIISLVSSLAGSLTKVGLILAGLFGALKLFESRLRKLGGGRGQAATRVELSRDHALHVIELDGRRLLIGTGPAQAPRLLLDLHDGRDGSADRGEVGHG